MPEPRNDGLRSWGLTALGAAGLAASLWLLSPLDLSLARSLREPGSAFGRIIALFGEWPGWLAVLLCAGRGPGPACAARGRYFSR